MSNKTNNYLEIKVKIILLFICFLGPILYAEEIVDTLKVSREHSIRINGWITDEQVEKLQDAFLKKVDKFHKRIYIVIDSNGGQVDSGLKMVKEINSWKALGVTVNCVVNGNAMSMAFYFLIGCDNRYITENSKLMWHNPTVYFDGFYNAKHLKLKLIQMLSLQIMLKNTLIDVTKIHPAIFKQITDNETILGAKDFVKLPKQKQYVKIVKIKWRSSTLENDDDDDF